MINIGKISWLFVDNNAKNDKNLVFCVITNKLLNKNIKYLNTDIHQILSKFLVNFSSKDRIKTTF